MTRETFGTSITRLAALAFALVAALALALAIAPGTARAANSVPNVVLDPVDALGECSTGSTVSGDGFSCWVKLGEGWEVVNWTDASGQEIGTAPSITLGGNYAGQTVTAHLRKSGPTPPTAKVDPTGAGTVASAVLAEGGFSYTATANEGWEFDQWNVVYGEGGASERTANPLYVDSNVREVTAYFKEKTAPATTYKIAVTDDGNGTAEASVAEAAAGAKVQLTATPKDRSYVFDKWVSDDVTVEGDAFEMPAKNVTVKATFKKAEPVTTYAITFDANGGTGTMEALTAEAGSTVILTANAFTREGYTFAGWNTAKDGTGTAYADKAEVKVEGDMTLYAQWKANSSKSTGKVAKTGDTTLPMTAVVGMAAALAAGVLLVARRRMG